MRTFLILATSLAILIPGRSNAASALSWDISTLGKTCIYYTKKNAPPPAKRQTDSKPDIVSAAEDLREYIKKMTGVELAVEETAPPPASGPAIVLGSLAVAKGAKPPETEFREDGYVIEHKGDQLLIAGESDRGTAFGVADFLHRQGVRFYMPGPYGEEVPNRRTIDLPEKPVIGKPDWSDRHLWLNGGSQNKFAEVAPDVPRWFDDWVRRNRANNGQNRIGTGHMWAAVFKSSGMTREEAFERHPDWFVAVGGKKNPRQLNLLNGEVVDLFVNHFKKQLAGQPKDTARILSISPDDQVIVNESAEAAGYMANKDIIFTNLPDATDYLIQFNNRVIRKLNEDYPNVRLAFYIYSNYQNAPTNEKLDGNLIPFIAPLNFSRYHALSDSSKPNRTLLANIVDRWHAHGARLGWRDYSFLCPDVMMPFNRLHMTRQDIPWLHKRGVRYISTETVSNWPNLLPEYWLLAQLLWDVNLNQEAALKEFYSRFFGAAAEPMRAYMDQVSETYNSLPFSAGNREFVGSTFPHEKLKSLREKIEAAKTAVAGDEVRLHRVKLVETALNQAGRFMKFREAVNRFDYAEAVRLDGEILKAWEDDIAFDGHTNTLFARDAWHRRHFSNHMATIAGWLEGAAVLHVFPDEWPAQFDFTQTGELEGLQLPASQGMDLFKLKTYSQSLAEQGWEKFRGHIWYRQTFPRPQVPPGQKLYILFGGVDRFLKAWINGQMAGEGTGGRDLSPVLIEVPDSLPLGEENTLVVRVANTSPTELGVGGIIRPVALIARPPLPPSAPSPTP